MYKMKIPAICSKDIKIIGKNREDAINKACYLIENNKIDDIEWRFTKDIHDALNTYALIPSKMYINEGETLEDGNVYLISIPCTGFANLEISGANEVDAINQALMYLRFNEVKVFNIKAHREILMDDSNILGNIVVEL